MVRRDMEFLFESSKRYLTSERSKQVRYWIEHEKRNSISPSNHVSLCLLYKHKAQNITETIFISTQQQ